ncbi:MAG: hypothetical protein KF878_07795 [Planctomycetes bacterium]|nr:hypothetical protein [Planctomycetota bacterium]
MSGFLALVGEPAALASPDLASTLLGLAHTRPVDLWRGGHDVLLASGPNPADVALGRVEDLQRGRLVVAVDARLDARDDLRAALLAANQQPAAGASDAALVAHACEAWGPACVERLRGDFSFVAWDPARRELFGARDPFGGRPLFYAEVQGGLVVSNAMCPVSEHPLVSDDLDELWLADFVLLGESLRPEASVFGAVRRLPPGHALLVRDGGLRSVRPTFALDPVPPLRGDEGEVRAQVTAALDAAVRDRLPSDRLGVLLSGGLDSPLIAALARRLAPALDMRGHFVHFERLIPDVEPPFVRRVADALGVPLRSVAADDVGLFDHWEHGSAFEPTHGLDLGIAALVDPGLVEHAPVAFTGHPSDALLMPDPLPLAAWHDGLRATLRGFCATWQRWRFRPSLSLAWAWRRLRPGSDEEPFPAWLDPEVVDRLGLRERWRVGRRDRPPLPGRRGDARAYVRGPVWATMFEQRHSCATGLALEFRHPLFDLRVVRALLGLPSLPWCQRKAVFRDLGRVAGLPEVVVLRQKAPLAGDLLQALADQEHAWPPAVVPPLAGWVRPGRRPSSRAHLEPWIRLVDADRWLALSRVAGE